MQKTFENWTDYDDWLTAPITDDEKGPKNYNKFDIHKIEEVDGKIVVDMEEKPL